MSKPQRKPVLPPVYFLSAIIVMVALHFVLPGGRWLASPLNLIGLAPIAAGVTLGIVGNVLFRRHDTTIKPFETASTIVTSGVFSFSRNPMYLGMNLVLIGIGLVQGSVVPFVVVPMFAWLIAGRFIVKEEGMLEAQFGEAYLEYKRRVRRWL